MEPTGRFAVVVFLLLAMAASGLAVQAQTGPAALANQPARDVHTSASETKLDVFGKLPLSFEANRGQADRQVKFLSRGSGYTVFLASNEAVLALRKGNTEQKHAPAAPANSGKHAPFGDTDFLRMRLEGANPGARVSGVDELPGKANYFVGNDPAKWQANLPTYAKVKYEEVYPGVDLIYYGNQRQLECDFVLAPGADAKAIRLRFRGATNLRVAGQGALVLQTRRGEVRFPKPQLYQKVEDKRRAIEGRYQLIRGRTVVFAVGSYDRTRPLIIDPVLLYSTYLGGTAQSGGNAIAVDSSGDAYVTGNTTSTDFPTVNALQPGNADSNTAFVSKINASGSALVYSTYLGGSGNSFGGDDGLGIALDSSGDAYVTGYTNSHGFPTVNAIQATNANPSGANAFVAKISASGSALVYSTYLGGSGRNGDAGHGIAVDSAGNAYVTGYTGSSDFPTANALQSTYAARGPVPLNAFISKINAGGSALVYSTYLGGSVEDVGNGIAVDSAGNAYVTGYTYSHDFPTANALQSTNASVQNFGNAFVAKVNSSGSALAYSTYLGGSVNDAGNGIALDSPGNAYVTGYTQSANFPTANALQSTNAGAGNAFVAKINPSGSALVYSTYLGGSGSDGGGGIAVDAAGNTYVTGNTSSINFPTVNALQSSNGGGRGPFVSEINASGSALSYSTYLGNGGGITDGGTGIVVDSSGNAYVTGITSTDNFPTVNAFQSSNTGLRAAFVAKIFSILRLSPRTLTFASQPVGIPTAPQTITLTNNSSSSLIVSNLAIVGANATDFGAMNNCVGSVPAGASCTINLTFTPGATGTRIATLAVTNSFTSSPVAAPLAGTGIASTRIASISASSLTFTGQMVGSTSSAQVLTLGNTGNTALTVASLAISGSNGSDFAETDNCGGSVAAGASCNINVTFAPTAAGTRTGTLAVADNATSPASPQTVTLSGVGQDFSVMPTSSQSATVTPGQTAAYPLTVTSNGGFNQSVTFACTGAPSQSTCAVSPSSIALNGSAAIAVTVTTTATSLLIHDNSGRGPVAKVIYRPMLLIGFILLFSLLGRHRELRLTLTYGLALLFLLGLGVTMSGCGGGSASGGGGNLGTPAGTYTLMVSGTFTSGSTTLTRNANLTLIVQ